MSSVARRALLASMCLLTSICPQAWAKDIHVLLLGDRLAASCQASVSSPEQGVNVLGGDGKERPITDPLAGKDCEAGSAWISLASRIKRQPGISKVVLVPVLVKNVKAGDWTEKTEAARRLAVAISAVQSRGARIDYALWQQGLADSSTTSNNYVNRVHMAIKRISSAIPVDKWLIATVGDCKNVSLEHIREAQRRLGQQVALNRFSGPRVDFSIEEKARECILSAHGKDVIAQQWFETIQEADILSRRSRLETLIHFFK